MSYIDYLNAFRRFRETHVITASAALLYYELLGVFNAALWQEEVSLTNKRAAAVVGVTEKTLVRAREELAEAGLISFVRCDKYVTYRLIDTAKKQGRVDGKMTVKTTDTDDKHIIIYKDKEKEKDKTARARRDNIYPKRIIPDFTQRPYKPDDTAANVVVIGIDSS